MKITAGSGNKNASQGWEDEIWKDESKTWSKLDRLRTLLYRDSEFTF